MEIHSWCCWRSGTEGSRKRKTDQRVCWTVNCLKGLNIPMAVSASFWCRWTTRSLCTSRLWRNPARRSSGLSSVTDWTSLSTRKETRWRSTSSTREIGEQNAKKLIINPDKPIWSDPIFVFDNLFQENFTCMLLANLNQRKLTAIFLGMFAEREKPMLICDFFSPPLLQGRRHGDLPGAEERQVGAVYWKDDWTPRWSQHHWTQHGQCAETSLLQFLEIFFYFALDIFTPIHTGEKLIVHEFPNEFGVNSSTNAIFLVPMWIGGRIARCGCCHREQCTGSIHGWLHQFVR